MALILGLDIATTTGFAWYDTDASLSAVRPGSFKIGGECYEARAGEMGQRIIKMVKQTRPDFVVIEQISSTARELEHLKYRLEHQP